MHNRNESGNESVHLWMLEQDRQKNRELTFEQQKARYSSEEVPHIPDHLLRSNKECCKHEEKTPADEDVEELDQLLREKTALEEESKRLDEERKQLILRTKLLLEGAIQDIKKSNNEKKQAVSDLKGKLANIEAYLR